MEGESMEKKSVEAARIDMHDEGGKELADKHREKRREETQKVLAKADSFVLVAITGQDGCAISAVGSEHSVSIVKMLGGITRQLLEETLKSGNIPVIMKMMMMMQGESKKMEGRIDK